MTMHEAAQKTAGIADAHACTELLARGITETKEQTDKVISVLREHLQTEKQHNKALAGNINTCTALFTALTASASRLVEHTEALNKRLTESCAALESVKNQETLFNDIRMNFSDIADAQSAEIDKEIQRILDRLADIARQCGGFQNFPKPYKDIIDLYSVRLESVFKILEKKMQNTLAHECFLSGAQCVYTNPERAIAELTEVLRINSANAEAYYYRAMAYQYKKKPDYSAALTDCKAALAINPASKIYQKCTEKLEEKISSMDI